VTSAALPARHAGPGRRPAGRVPGSTSAWSRRDLADRLARLVVCACLLGIALVLPWQNLTVRDYEARLAMHVIATSTGVQTGSYGGSLSMVWFLLNPHFRVGLIITPDCTVALLGIPFLVASAVLIWQRGPLARTMIGLAVTLALLLMLNQARLLLIAGMVLTMGYRTGFYWGHTMLGSVFLVFGLVVILGIFALFATSRGIGRRRR
jgi:exosortase/archaeosortase family protein